MAIRSHSPSPLIGFLHAPATARNLGEPPHCHRFAWWRGWQVMTEGQEPGAWPLGCGSAGSKHHTGWCPDAETPWGTQGLGHAFLGALLLWGTPFSSPLAGAQTQFRGTRPSPLVWSLSLDSGRITHLGASISWVPKRCLNEYSLGKWMWKKMTQDQDRNKMFSI